MKLRVSIVVFLVAQASFAAAQTFVSSRQNFVAAVPSPTVLGFDQFPANTTLTGSEYAALGVTFQHLDGQPIYVANWTTMGIPSGPNAISSSYASFQGPGFVAACCGVYFNNANADHFRF